MFQLIKTHLLTYKFEAPKLFKLVLFNYLFSNGDAHLKNFSLVETPMSDYRLSPAYDLLNTLIHIDDTVFALEEGLLPKNLAKDKIKQQFISLAKQAEISEIQVAKIFDLLTANTDKVITLINASYFK